MSKRLIAIGDIHGEIEKLNSLLENLKLHKSDTLIFLGDYIDRGNYSKEVIEKLIGLSKIYNCVFLKGNHESMLINTAVSRKEEDIEHWLLSGGIATYDNYGDYPSIFNTHGEFLKNLLPFYETEHYLFVHAGVHPNKFLSEQDFEDLYWIREPFLTQAHKIGKVVIFGHTSFKEPFIDKDKIGIDTGCGKFKDAKLTAYICNEQRIVTSD